MTTQRPFQEIRESKYPNIEALGLRVHQMETLVRGLIFDVVKAERLESALQSRVELLAKADEEIALLKEIVADSTAGRDQWRKTQRENTELKAKLEKAERALKYIAFEFMDIEDLPSEVRPLARRAREVLRGESETGGVKCTED